MNSKSIINNHYQTKFKTLGNQSIYFRLCIYQVILQENKFMINIKTDVITTENEIKVRKNTNMISLALVFNYWDYIIILYKLIPILLFVKENVFINNSETEGISS